MDEILIVTTNDVPGYEITQVQGEVCGLIVRARNVFSNVGASMRTVFGGEARGYTTLLLESREQAIDRLRDAARQKGANAVVAMRFDCNVVVTVNAMRPRKTNAAIPTPTAWRRRNLSARYCQLSFRAVSGMPAR